MIALYGSNYRSMPLLCLLLILLFYEGGNGAPLMGEEGMTLLCSFKSNICMRETSYQGMYFCQICETFVAFHGMVIDSFMYLNSSSRIFIMNMLSPKS